MSVDAKTIQLFLPDGEPRGLRIAEITTRIIQAIQIPRVRLDQALKRPELDHIGAYFLFGISDELARPEVYIGQSEDLRYRLKMHHAEKDFWTTAVAIVSRTDSFTLAHIRYLEWHSIKISTEVGRFTLKNGNSGMKPFITEPILADVLDAFDTASVLLSTLGFPIFDPLTGAKTETPSSANEYSATGIDAKAKGHPVEDGFVVLKNSLARAKPTASAEHLVPKYAEMLKSGVIVPEGPSYRFVEDYVFNTPSGAAVFVLGRPSNGWDEWKLSDGKTLHDVERAESTTTA